MAKKDKDKKKETAKNQEQLIQLIDREFGTGTIMKGRGKIVDVPIFSTGIAAIDVALGIGGLPQGRIIEVYGPESHGKTTICLQFIAACQKHSFEEKEREGVCAFIDAEHALDPSWAEKIGVDMEQLLLSQPGSGEEAFTIVEMMVKSKLIDLIVVDSVAALVPQVELTGELTDANIGAHARLMSKALRKLKGDINTSKTTVIFINQIREKIGVMFGSPEVTPGGRALKFYASIRADIRRGNAIKDGDDTIGFKTKIKVVKNKVAPPFMVGEFDICVGKGSRPIHGVDAAASLVDVANDFKVVTRSGNHFSFNGTVLGNGMARASAFVRENPDVAAKIHEQTYDRAFGALKKCGVTESGESDELDNDILDED